MTNKEKKEFTENISHNIKVIRDYLGHTQGSFSDLLGIKRSSIGAYEEGRAFPPINVLMKISDLCDYHIEDICHHKLEKVLRMSNRSFEKTLEL